MANFDWYLNKQGPRGPQGIQGEQGFSPIITVATNTLSEYVLQIQTQNSTFLTANLREHKDDLGGTYIRLNRETGVMYAGDADMGSQSQYGVVRFATASDIERQDSTSVVSPADVINIIGFVPEDISRLEDRVDDLEAETESLEIDISTNTNAISELQSSVVGLLENYVPKSRTINGHNLSSNITLTASDVNAYNKSETDTLLASKADVSDLPNMNNYYNTTQIDLMLNEKADVSEIPTVGNGTITINQGGVLRGQFSVNQSGDVTINLTDGGGGGGGSYIEGNGIDITNGVISAKVDGTTIGFDNSGNLTVIGGGSAPSNMVTTDTNQTVSGIKTYSYRQNFDGGIATNSLYNQTGTSQIIFLSSSNTDINTASLTTTRNNTAYTVLDSGNVGTYALTSLPIATTSALGGVIPDGTTITIDNDGTIHSVGGGGSAPSNMVTTDTAQTITGAKTFDDSTIKATGYIRNNRNEIVVGTASSSGNIELGNSNRALLLIGTDIGIQRGGFSRTNIDTGNISSYALTSLPTASTSTLGGVKVDGTTITIDSNGVISSSGSGGTVDQTYDATSTNAQSGTAVAEAVADKVDNSELVDVQVVIESSSVSLLPSFYKVFSDGTCIQGGNCTSGTAVTFLKEFANTNYINTCSASASSTTGFTPSTTGSYIVFGQVSLT